jgi:hypothetical protein
MRPIPAYGYQFNFLRCELFELCAISPASYHRAAA